MHLHIELVLDRYTSSYYLVVFSEIKYDSYTKLIGHKDTKIYALRTVYRKPSSVHRID